MNLHEHSQTHNWEMGVRFSKQADPEIYENVIKELGHMSTQTKQFVLKTGVAEESHHYKAGNTSKPVRTTVFKPTEAPNKGIFDKILDTVTGESSYCIRCGKGLEKFDLQRPYCDACYPSWARYKNPKYKEKYLPRMRAGNKEGSTSFEKPVCKICFTRLYKK